MSVFPMKKKSTPTRVALARLQLIALAVTLLGSAAPGRADDVDNSPPPKEPVQLAPLEVRGDRARDENYRADRSRTGTRTDTALQDVPQSITVVTSEQILDQ